MWNLNNLYIWYNSTDEYEFEELIEYTGKGCVGCMKHFTHGEYLYFKDNGGVKKSIIKFSYWITNHNLL